MEHKNFVKLKKTQLFDFGYHVKATSKTTFLVFRCVPCVRSKSPTTFYMLKKASNSRDCNYSLEFSPLKSLSEK